MHTDARVNVNIDVHVQRSALNVQRWFSRRGSPAHFAKCFIPPLHIEATPALGAALRSRFGKIHPLHGDPDSKWYQKLIHRPPQ